MCVSEAVYKSDSVTAVLSGETGQNSSKLLCENVMKKSQVQSKR